MKCVGLFLLATFCFAESFDHAKIRDNGVLVLTDKNFDTTIKKYEHIIVAFYAPWCGWSKRLWPEYNKAATILKETNSRTELGKVDCTKEKATCENHGVRGFPTIMSFDKGIESVYQGARKAEALVKFASKKAAE